jgi:hypothetical protein
MGRLTGRPVGRPPIPIMERFFDHISPEPNTGCHLWMGAQLVNGYPKVWKDKINTQELAHRVAWELANGPIPDGLFVCHRCDVPLCVNPVHLFLGTAADNHADMVGKGRQAKGFQLPHTKLTSEQIEEIRRRPETQAAIAKEFGIHQSHVSRIKSQERRA